MSHQAFQHQFFTIRYGAMPCGFLVAETALPLFLISTDFTLVTLRIQYLIGVSANSKKLKESGMWERVGEAGWGRAFHTGAVHGDKLYAFGGFNIFHFCFNDLLRYNPRNIYNSCCLFNKLKLNHSFAFMQWRSTALHPIRLLKIWELCLMIPP